MKPRAHNDFSKLQIICALFAGSIGGDLYFARQIKESIEATLPPSRQDDPAAFLDSARALAAESCQPPEAPSIDLILAPDADTYSELALRARLLEALKRTCRFPRPLLVLAGLKEAICPQGRRWTARRKQEYQDAIAYARDFCQSRSRPSSQLDLIIY